jgi:hypothetical protein
MVGYDLFCPFQWCDLCGLDDNTGKKMEADDIRDTNAPCGFSGKEMWECARRRKFMLTITRPGFCIADIPDTDLKIKARMQRIEHLELEKICIQDKIDIMKHEIEELNTILDKPRK